MRSDSPGVEAGADGAAEVAAPQPSVRREILINSTPKETRVALLEDGV
ncbi:MAG: hypothetical protein H0V06_08505, partial [Gemmatimonadetes bacterium]|nr:hypothetical protein [Gemmatimonadota bacterium]